MAIPSGTRLGPYEVLAPIGAGGMGEVYRATDSRLRREVAIKVLPSDVCGDPDRLRRFEQEARAASALNHPNVLVVHDIGGLDAAPYVVTELLDGSTLREHLTGVPLPWPRAVAYAADVARGLAAAHDRAIVHRDIKPENLFITRDARVKILDFGIATIAPVDPPSAMTTRQQTEPGLALGTVGYMSPEQVKGDRVDSRSDIFALGVVLYEMLAGQPPFTRGSRIETASAILADTPADLSVANAAVPLPLERIVRHCLEKDPTQRFQSARDVAFALEGLVSSPLPAAAIAPTTSARRSRKKWLAYGGLTAFGLGAAALLGANYRRAQEEVPVAARFEIPAPVGGSLQGTLGVSSVISPDGSTLVMVVTTATGQRLFVRPLAATAPRPLDGTEGAVGPFWSPDSRWIAFFSGGKLRRVRAEGGTPQPICDLAWTSIFSTGSWGSDDTILMATVGPDRSSNRDAIYRVPATGGVPMPVLEPRKEDGRFAWPSFLSDGRHFLLYASPLGAPAEIRVAALGSQETTRLMQASSRAIYAEPGYLLYVSDGTLMARPFDVRSLSLTGPESVAAADLLFLREVGQADFSISRNGVLAYQAGSTASRLVWYQRDGTPGSEVGEPAEFTDLRLSPDERKVAVTVFNRQAGTTDIRLLDLTRGGEASAVTSDAALDLTPVFSPDSQQLAFAAARRGPAHVFVKRLTDPGMGNELVPPSSFAPQFVSDWANSVDGEVLLYSDSGPSTGVDIMAIDPTGARPASALVNTTADQMDGRISPDGQWLAYASNHTGRSEVYVRSLQTGQQWPVSSTGAVSPRWRRDGNGSDYELYYLSHISRLPFALSAVNGELMAVRITTGGGFRAGVAQRLFNVVARAGQVEPSRDGQRFLVNVGNGNAALPITIALDWRRMMSR